MKEFIEKLIEKLGEETHKKYVQATLTESAFKLKEIAGFMEGLCYATETVNQLAEEYKQQNIDQDLMIVESLPSLYPMMQPFEVEAINRVVSSAKHSGGWVLVSDKLPYKDMWCLATFESGGIDKIQYLVTNKWGWNGEFADNKVVAWMPLPDPFKQIAE